MEMIKWRKKVKEKEDVFNEFKINLKFIEGYYTAIQFTKCSVFITMLDPYKKSCSTVTLITLPEMKKPRLRKIKRFAHITQVISSESSFHTTQSSHSSSLKPPWKLCCSHPRLCISLQLLSLPLYFYCSVYSLLCSSFSVPLNYFMPIRKSSH